MSNQSAGFQLSKFNPDTEYESERSPSEMQEPRVERAASAEFQFVMKDRRFFVLHQISVLALWIAVFMDECNYRNTSTLAWKGNANQIIRNLVCQFFKK